MPDISHSLIARAVGGDEAAFEAIYRECSRFVYNVAWRIVHTRDDAEEVTQEVFVFVYRKLNGFRFQSSFKTWMYRVTINTAVNYVKRMARHRQEAGEYREELHAAGPSLTKEQVDKEHHEYTVQRLLDALPPEQKACVILRNVEGLSYQQIAETLNINLNTVRSRLSRARETLLRIKKEVMSHEL